MSIRYKVMLVCLSFVAITIGVGLFCHNQQVKLGNLALSIYDEAFIGVNYAHKSQAEFIRFTGSHDSKDTAAIMAQDDVLFGRLLDNLDIAIERAMSDKGRSLATEIRKQVAALRGQAPGTPLQPAKLHEIDMEMNRLVDRYTADGFIYRVHSSEIVTRSRSWLILVLSGAVLLAIATAFILQRSIIPPIIHAAEVAMAIEAGKLDNKIRTGGSGETAALLKALEQMQSSIAGNIRHIEEVTRRAERERIANLTKSEFLTNMSHELRTPMHAILGFSRLALKRVDAVQDKKLFDMVSNIQLSGNRLLTLLNALLDLSKLEAGKILFEFRKDDIRIPIQHAMMEMGALTQSKGIRITLEDDGLPKVLAYDHGAMIQVFMNLLSNAIKFSPPDSEVRISLSETSAESLKPQLLCRIQDEGAGIPESELESVFDKFVQSSKTKSGAGGTGLGLAIVRQIITTHNGRVWVENVTPTGACFNLLLPYEQSELTKGSIL